VISTSCKCTFLLSKLAIFALPFLELAKKGGVAILLN
jgi:hypothetical protein